MKAVVWHGKEDVRVDNVPDPEIREPTDAVVRVTSTAICGSDLHLYSKLSPLMREGDIIGHEPMGVVEEVGPEVSHIQPGDRVVVPFNVSCGSCFFCDEKLYSQCETTRDRGKLANTLNLLGRRGKGASLFGYTHVYGAVPGGQAEYLRVPQAHFGPVRVPEEAREMPDERFLYLSDVLPTAWQAVEYAGVPDGGSVAVFGLGPVGQMSARIALHKGLRVIGVDLVPERLRMASRYGIETVDYSAVDSAGLLVVEMTGGRGADAAIDAVGMEAGGSFVDSVLSATKVQVDKAHALRECMASIRRGGTLSISGVYAGPIQMFPLGDLFDMQIQVRMGQANVRRWTDDIMPLLTGDGDPLGVEDFATHKMPLDEAPRAYEIFQNKQDGAIKVVLKP